MDRESRKAARHADVPDTLMTDPSRTQSRPTYLRLNNVTRVGRRGGKSLTEATHASSLNGLPK
jgi:hypothetical protein